MPTEPYLGQHGVTSSADRWYPVTPNDNADLPIKPKMIHVNGGGTVAMLDADGTLGTFTFASGAEKPLRPHRILATGTTATGILACW